MMKNIVPDPFSGEKLIDLRSDTVTQPSPGMRQAMANAVVGDDVYGEDPTIIALEEKAAALLGYEAGLFLTSGTQGNLVALLAHTQPGQEVILEERAHIYFYEVGGLAFIGGLMTRTVPGYPGCQGYLAPEMLEAAVRGDNIHFPTTGLICLENTHNLGGGAATSREQVEAMLAVAAKYKVAVHLDGARVMNAAVALKIPVAQLVQGIDSVQLCLSKGLGAPVGSVLVGSEELILRARKFRKMLGGGMRQAGIIAAAGLYALEHNIARLAEDHQHASNLANTIAAIPGMKLVAPTVPTNIVLFDTAKTGRDAEAWVAALAAKGVKCGSMSATLVRMVTHLDISTEDIHRVSQILHEIA
ncbi:MAG: low-specificity L-threonine aldolase [Symbiobacteriaceae bacterium]|nr:low-specificity L-threonine aldolase [Symbiobacteriaceae bacterium]